MSCSNSLSPLQTVRLMPTEDGALLLHLETDYFYTLNQTAGEVWQALQQGKGAQGAAVALSGEYQIPLSQAREFVDAFVEELVKESLVQYKQEPNHR